MPPLSNFGGTVQGNRAAPMSQGAVAAQQQSPQGLIVPFQRAAKIHTEAFPTQVGTISGSNQTIVLRVPISGYLKRIWLEVSVVTASNAATVAFGADAPWNFFRTILFRDANGTPIHNLSGYYTYLAQLLGGYTLFRLDGSALSYSVVTGVGAGLGGSFTFVLPINQAFGRDGLGALPNMDSSTQYQIELTIGTTADLYPVTPPTNPGTFSIQAYVECFMNPPTTDQAGNQNRTSPPNVGTAQFWSYSNYNLNAGGENTILLNRVGNLIRNHFLVFRTSAGVRSVSVLPNNNLVWEWDSTLMFSDNVLWRQGFFYDGFGFDLPTGVISYPRTLDPDGVPVGEYGDQYLQTYGSTKLLIRITPQAAGQLDVITNDIVPVGNIYPSAN